MGNSTEEIISSYIQIKFRVRCPDFSKAFPNLTKYEHILQRPVDNLKCRQDKVAAGTGKQKMQGPFKGFLRKLVSQTCYMWDPLRS